jgi:hypothetical protein
MAFETRIIKDTIVSNGSGGTVTVLCQFTNDTADNLGIDGDGLSGFANGSKLDIQRIWWSVSQSGANATSGYIRLKFVGSSGDSNAITLAGTGFYDGTAGTIKSNATNTTATSADINIATTSASGHVLVELKKDANWTG